MELKCNSLEMDEEREEGELSDEELEDVSDSSISIGSIILCDSNIMCREPFKELSLTSVSDESSDNVSIIEVTKAKPSIVQTKLTNQSSYRRYCKHRQLDREYSPVKRFKYSKLTPRRYSKTKSTFQQYSSVSSSSSESEFISDKKVLRQLRDAVRISSTKKNPNCSLRSRIKRMIEPDSPGSKHTNSDDDQELENLRDQALKSKSTNSNPSEDAAETEEQTSTITDEDLINLRLIALQSAVLKKHENRRKRKEQQLEIKKKQDEVIVEALKDIEETNNLESMASNNNEPKIVDDKLVDSNGNNDEIRVGESVEDISSKIENKLSVDEIKINAQVEKSIQKSTADDDEDILRAMLLTSISRKIANKVNTKTNNPEEKSTKPTTITSYTNTSKVTTTSNVKVPIAPVKRLIININSDSESDSNMQVIKKKKEPAVKSSSTKNHFEQNLSKFLKEARIKSEMQQQSDISRHLPRSQQIEYRHLKRKLQQLSKNKSHQKVKKSDGDENKRIRVSSISKRSVSKLKPSNPLTTQVVHKATADDKKLNNNVDRLQIKGKYEGLAPLMIKITQARTAREKAQTEVKRLINELRNARVKLTSTHQNYTVLIQQLLQAKANLDERTNILPCSDNQEVKKSVAPAICTSTPLKVNIKESICEISNIMQQGDPPQESLVQTGEPAVENKLETIPNDINDIGSEKEKEDVIIEVPKNIEVKMDMDNVQEHIGSDEGLAKYSSPLDHIQEKSEQYVGNPLLVLCPYDLLGVCRDPDCSYQH